MNADDRDCRFMHENGKNDSMFLQYRQLGCLFECRLKYAIRNSGCIPWDYPIPEGVNEAETDICTAGNSGRGNLASFQDLMNSENSTKKCKCLPDCEEIKYERQVKATYLPTITKVK